MWQNLPCLTEKFSRDSYWISLIGGENHDFWQCPETKYFPWIFFCLGKKQVVKRTLPFLYPFFLLKSSRYFASTPPFLLFSFLLPWYFSLSNETARATFLSPPFFPTSSPGNERKFSAKRGKKLEEGKGEGRKKNQVLFSLFSFHSQGMCKKKKKM